MKYCILLTLIIILQSCATVPESKVVDSDYEIAQLTLGNFTKWDEYRLMQEPSTSTTDDYLEGFATMELIEFPQKFHYKGSNKEKWKKRFFNDPEVKKKLRVIKDYESIPVTSEREKNKIYMSMSRPIYSEDGKYAVVIVNMLSDNILWGGGGDGYVYEKISGKWKLHLKFVPYLT
ncbi:hypothetical protein E0W68_11665 [Flavobacterium salilacus subsp. salilacus]|uniref:hypothetical protein n=1 Tax=Flavobacterium TaxID=237 RepID=UPI001074F9FF|nr:MULTISPECIES: hypothetical protein [Flavobacterium]KAF2516866.1 hypothetical protein E0W68_11665 [Flavobacterium salilacus subsp. salilacus]MBE1615775.1 hypothetical protein [Flavobacterium sp. SaA2.13]